MLGRYRERQWRRRPDAARSWRGRTRGPPFSSPTGRGNPAPPGRSGRLRRPSRPGSGRSTVGIWERVGAWAMRRHAMYGLLYVIRGCHIACCHASCDAYRCRRLRPSAAPRSFPLARLPPNDRVAPRPRRRRHLPWTGRKPKITSEPIPYDDRHLRAREAERSHVARTRLGHPARSHQLGTTLSPCGSWSRS